MANLHMKRTLLEIVDNQIRDNDPPATRETFNRLVNEGAPKALAKERIAAVVSEEIYDVLKHHLPYNAERYSRKLLALQYKPKD